jgi:Cu/Ag efflux pump CusA
MHQSKIRAEENFMWTIITFISLMSIASAEVWEKPVYVPDENHLPSAEVQEQEERKDKQEMKARIEKEKEENIQLYKGKAPKKVTPHDP